MSCIESGGEVDVQGTTGFATTDVEVVEVKGGDETTCRVARLDTTSPISQKITADELP